MTLGNSSAPESVTVNRVRTYLKNKDYVMAEKLCKELLIIEPKNVEVLSLWGHLLQHFKKNREARNAFSVAISLTENKLGNFYIELGNSYCNDELYNEALSCYKKAFVLVPKMQTNLYNNIGIIYKKQNDFDKAIECYEKSLKLNPENVATMSNFALAHKEKGNFETAENLYKKAISLKPDFVCAYYNWGLTLKDQNRPLEAIPLIEKALELDAGFTDAYMDYAICLLVTKNFEKGWRAYEDRYAGLVKPKPAGNKPMWQGESLEGKTIYVFHEQGHGDTIQFVRYLPLLKQMGAKVLFKPQDKLVTLFKQSDLDVEIVDRFLNEDEYDYYSLLLSIPYQLKANADNVPSANGYLKANPAKITEYNEKYFKDVNKLKVGIFWQGSAEFKNDKNRSTKLESFYKLAQLNNVQLYSLQKGFGEEQLENLPEDINIIKLGDAFEDFGDTAAAIENLDLVISVDSSVAHLAGALGKPVWILLSYVWEWRWFGSDDKTPWYDSMKIFNQKEAKNWDELFSRVYDELKKLSEN